MENQNTQNLTPDNKQAKSSEPINKNLAMVCGTIIVASVIISGTILYNNYTSQKLVGGGLANQRPVLGDSASLDKMAPVTEKDHIRGNKDASVVIVEYSDFECPFCKKFHPTMQQAVKEFGDKIAWVYRHFPLDSLHPVKARKEAMASECANEQGGNDAFWKYIDRFFELTPSNNQTDIDKILPQIAKEIGLDVNKFNTCLNSGKYDQHISDDVKNAQATGGNGTPWSIVVAKNGKKFPLSGAQPYESVKQLIELALQEK